MIPEPNLQTRFKIFSYVRDGIPTYNPLSIDHKKDVNIRFAEKNIIDHRGFKIKTEVYESSSYNIDPTTLLRTISYDSLIKIIDTSYVIGEDKGLLSRHETFSFCDSENNIIVIGDTKIKYYDSNEAVIEGITRRKNVIDLLKRTTVGLILQTEISKGNIINVPEAEDLAKPIILELSNNISAFISGNTRVELVAAINACNSFGWLNNIVDGSLSTIRDYMAYTINNSRIDD